MGFLAIISIFRPKIRNDSIFLLIAIPMIIFSGLRWEMGTDWSNYLQMFLSPDGNYLKSMEPGYQCYIKFIRLFTDNYSVFLLLTDTFALGGISYLIFRYSNRNFLSLFYSTGTLFWYAGSLRQMLSLLFLTISIKFIFSRKPTHFIICLSFATLFHKSALFFIVNYFIFGYSYLITIFISVLIIIFIRNWAVIFDYLISIFFDIVSIQFRFDGGGMSQSNPWLGIPRKLFSFFSIFIFYTKIKIFNTIHEEKIYNFYFKMLILSMVFYIIGSFYIEHVSSRMDIFTGIICTSILIGLIDNKLIKKVHRFYFLMVVIIFNLIFYSRLEFLDLFHPYTSIFYNYDYVRYLY